MFLIILMCTCILWLAVRHDTDGCYNSSRARFHSGDSFKLLTLLLSVLPERGSGGREMIDLTKLSKLIWSHPELLTVMTSEGDKKRKGKFEQLCFLVDDYFFNSVIVCRRYSKQFNFTAYQ